MKTVALPSGEQVPAFGQGTWRMGEREAACAGEIGALQLGIDLGATLIDTAEMYGDGRTEELVGKAIKGRREGLFLVSKVLPENASRKDTVKACERSLRRLGTDRLDLYLLHWRGEVPLEETLEGLVALRDTGKIRYYGVSNLDFSDMQEVWQAAGGCDVMVNQVLYNLSRRGVEWDLLPWLQQRNIPVMAYSPLEQARLVGSRKLKDFARQNDMTPAQVALAWLLAKDNVIVIPKTASETRLRENLEALTCTLNASQLTELDALFPPPHGPEPLAML